MNEIDPVRPDYNNNEDLCEILLERLQQPTLHIFRDDSTEVRIETVVPSLKQTLPRLVKDVLKRDEDIEKTVHVSLSANWQRAITHAYSNY